MSKAEHYDALNRLLTVLYRSLPMYLTYASPWTHRGDQRALEVLKQIAHDEEQLATRVAEHVIERYGRVELGEFPLDFPDTHDLALDYLFGKAVACQRSDVEKIERIVTELRSDPQAAALAEEALGAARGHLETLEELAAETAKHGVSWAKT
jgi:hypothetical protein